MHKPVNIVAASKFPTNALPLVLPNVWNENKQLSIGLYEPLGDRSGRKIRLPVSIGSIFKKTLKEAFGRKGIPVSQPVQLKTLLAPYQILNNGSLKEFDKSGVLNKIKQPQDLRLFKYLEPQPSVEATLKACEADALAAHQQTKLNLEEGGLSSASSDVAPLTVQTMLISIRHTTSLIEQLLEAHPELANVNFRKLDKNSTSTLGIAIRQSVWSVFCRSGALLGRNTREAITADATDLIKASLSKFDIAGLDTGKGRYADDLKKPQMVSGIFTLLSHILR
jgi:hypothetical protein